MQVNALQVFFQSGKSIQSQMLCYNDNLISNQEIENIKGILIINIRQNTVAKKITTI
jgi:hypothetical protein